MIVPALPFTLIIVLRPIEFPRSTTVHQAHGVSKACFRAADLLAGRLEFDSISLAQIRPVLQARTARPAENYPDEQLPLAGEDAAVR